MHSDTKANGIHVSIAGGLVIALALGASAATVRFTANEIDRAHQLNTYMQAATASLGLDQLDALATIKDHDRRYLATTFYLRVGSSIASRWSWTNEQIVAYEKSTEHAEALAEIEAIAQRFSAANPHYRLHANTRIRSLEEQLRRWQKVGSIGVAARELRTAALSQLALASYESRPSAVSTKRFQKFLATWQASHAPTLAAPGLSLHGRGRAYDFQIQDKKGRTIAGADSSAIDAIWEDQGWAEKLALAVRAAGNKFSGPLIAPYEPWHYEYRSSN